MKNLALVDRMHKQDAFASGGLAMKVSFQSGTSCEFPDQKIKSKVLEIEKLIHTFDILSDEFELKLKINI